ncbi:MAG TPA: MFS transporter [Caulobacteraceae bacterium]|jgi:DHA2 family methylenomycin A resistance protein-like MFS transporter|nr:MFS transporter [Caulobacteraceae bacterium]
MTSVVRSKSSGAGWTIAAASFGFMVVQLDVTIVNVALPAMARDLGGGTAGLQWVVDAYTLSFAVLLLSAGVLGDLFGARRLYLAGFGLFAAASAGAALAPSAGLLIAARAVQGAAAALMVPNSLVVLNFATGHDDKLRARAVGIWTAASGMSIGVGPVVGGLLLSFGWRSIFWVNLPICLVGAALTLAFAPVTPLHPEDRRLDLPGQALAILALTGLVGGVIEARPLGLTHPLVIGAGLLFAAAAIGFVRVERRTRAPMLPLHFFGNAGFDAAVGFGIAVNLSYYGVLFVLALYLQGAHGWSPLQAGLAILPLTLTFVVSNLVSGWLIGRFGSRLPMMIGGLIGAVGYGLLVTLDARSAFAQMLPIFLLIPFGMGLGVPAMTTAILAGVDHAWSGTASAVLNAARQAAGAMGVAIFGALAANGEAVRGLHAAGLISAALLLLGAALAWRWIAGKPNPAG